jgi:hypothetical protein
VFYIVGRNTDVLAWNPPAAALITDFGALPPARRNLARLVFLDDGVRNRYADWAGKARDVAAYLRLDAARHPDGPHTAQLVDELTAASPEFRCGGRSTMSRTRSTVGMPASGRRSPRPRP